MGPRRDGQDGLRRVAAEKSKAAEEAAAPAPKKQRPRRMERRRPRRLKKQPLQTGKRPEENLPKELPRNKWRFAFFLRINHKEATTLEDLNPQSCDFARTCVRGGLPSPMPRLRLLHPWSFPYTGNRTGVWIVAQLHILFAAFILGAPLFAVVSEWLGYKNQDPKYDRLAKEVTKVTVILYSMTALTGGLFIFVLLATYPGFTTWLIKHFFLVFAVIYPLLFILETIVLYLYFYSWDSLKGEKKARHIAIGVLLNVVGTVHVVRD